jgi:RluA family pseudouridine synthase
MSTQTRLPVLFEDESMLAVNKPAGLLSLPDGYIPDAPDLLTVLQPSFGDLWIVHRLDRETSGVVVLARNEKAHAALNGQFENRQVSKVYHALVTGNPIWTERSISAPLRVDADRYHRTLIDQDEGKPAETSFKVLERFGRQSKRYTLVEAHPLTGRTHQIRVHLAALGVPVAVDALYGTKTPIMLSDIKRGYRGDPETERPLLERLGLHACQLTVQHPVTGESITFEAPYSRDIAATLNQLRKHAAA